VRRVVIPDSFYVLDGLLHTFMTILNEFGVFEENIKTELAEKLPFLATTKILMECVKVGVGREVAHEIIKKYFTSSKPGDFFTALANDKNFPLSVAQLKSLVQDPSSFSGLAIEQSEAVKSLIEKVITGKISKVELDYLR
jgi:adenylosuccinate lyase